MVLAAALEPSLDTFVFVERQFQRRLSYSGRVSRSVNFCNTVCLLRVVVSDDDASVQMIGF